MFISFYDWRRQTIREPPSRIFSNDGASLKAFAEAESHSTTLDSLDVGKIEGNIPDPESFTSSLKSWDEVFYCAAITDQWAPAEKIWNVNLVDTKNVLNASNSQGIANFIHIGLAGLFCFASRENIGDGSSPFPGFLGIVYHESKHKAIK